MSLFGYTRAGREPGGPRPPSPLLWIALIALIAGGLVLAFAWLAGWIGRDRVTAQTFTDAIEATGPPQPGFRRAHTKGVCVSGVFQGTPEGAALSSARVFRQRQVPVLGRLSIGGGDPHGAEAGADGALAHGLVVVAAAIVRVTGAGGDQKAGAGDGDNRLVHGSVLHPEGAPLKSEERRATVAVPALRPQASHYFVR